MIINTILRHISQIDALLKQASHRHLFNISPSHLALFLSLLDSKFVVIEPTHSEAVDLHKDLEFFCRLFNKPSPVLFPPAEDLNDIGIRAEILLNLNTKSALVASKASLEELPAIKAPYTFEVSAEIDRDSFEEILLKAGYQRQALALEHGTFSRRNWIFDIYPAGQRFPVRVEFFGDSIESIRLFDPDTQKSLKPLQMFELFSINSDESTTKTYKDYFDSFATFVSIECKDAVTDVEAVTTFCHLPIKDVGIDSAELSFAGFNLLPSQRTSLEDIKPFISDNQRYILCVLPSSSQCQRAKEIFACLDVSAFVLDSGTLHAFEGRVAIIQGELSSGFLLPNIAVLTDIELFGQRPTYKSPAQTKQHSAWDSFEDIAPGDLIVHKEHGIGKFVEIKREKTEEFEEDLFVIEYLGGDRIYVPFQWIENIKKYICPNPETVELDKLGSKKWKLANKRAKQSIKDMAERLLKIYAQRKSQRGFTFSKDTHLHHEFDEFFPYQPTPDQLKAIEEIKRLMYEDAPMDMLVCGDVGYGKTEVAMRAVFRAVYDGKQVAVLAPTTLLVSQHYRTFKTRFEGFDTRIETLSRFDSPKSTEDKLKRLARGEIDIIISTHKLLGKDVKFQDLGLLIVDEEHKFGVAQKEKIKELCSKVDVITLTATPIPRTLHMALSGIRSMTTIETPPEDRLSVKSIITTYSEDVIKEALQRELNRQGQAFYLYNRIEDMDIVLSRLKRLMPSAKIEIAHGKMPKAQIEDIMMRFLQRQIDILLCTTIIGSGIDIPNANTIIIEDAQNFGLADLYQLRGRVGRSNRQAYAYFLIQNHDSLSDYAKKRIKALQELSYLGAGFRLAMADLEIRGAGNLLGAEQSGHINRVGLDLYLEMLQEAVAELKGEPLPDKSSVTLNLKVSAFIPEDYIADVPLRLTIYKRIASIKALQEAEELQAELKDRFGILPLETMMLLQIVKLKLLAISLAINKIDNLGGYFRVFFDSSKAVLSPQNIINALQSFKKLRYKFMPDGFELDLRGLKQDLAIKQLSSVLAVIANNKNN